MAEYNVWDTRGNSIIFRKRKEIGYPQNIVLAIIGRSLDGRTATIPDEINYEERVEFIFQSVLTERENIIIKTLFKEMETLDAVSEKTGIPASQVVGMTWKIIRTLQSKWCQEVIRNGIPDNYKLMSGIAKSQMSERLKHVILKRYTTCGDAPSSIQEFSQYSEKEVECFYGMGKELMSELKRQMEKEGVSFAPLPIPTYIHNIGGTVTFCSFCEQNKVRDVRQFTGWLRAELYSSGADDNLMHEIEEVMKKFDLNFYNE